MESEVGVKNKSSGYIVPLIDEYLEIHRGFLLNSYLFDINHPELNTNNNIDGLFILLRWQNNEVLKKYEHTLLKSSHVKLHYDVDNESFMVYIKFTEPLKKIVKFIVNGKYSRLDDSDKKTILRYWNAKSTHKMYGILYKTNEYRRQLEHDLNVKLDDSSELGSIFDLHQETFKTIIKNKKLELQ